MLCQALGAASRENIDNDFKNRSNLIQTQTMMRQLATQKAVNDLIPWREIFDEPAHQVEVVIGVLALRYLLEFVFALKWANRHHLIFAVVVGFFGADEAPAELAFAAFLLMNAHDSLTVFIELGFHPFRWGVWKVDFDLVADVIQLQMDQSFNWLLPDLDQDSVINFFQDWVVKSGISFVPTALQNVSQGKLNLGRMLRCFYQNGFDQIDDIKVFIMLIGGRNVSWPVRTAGSRASSIGTGA